MVCEANRRRRKQADVVWRVIGYICDDRRYLMCQLGLCTKSAFQISASGCQQSDLWYTVSQKRPTILFVHNFAECWPILQILSPLDLATNFQYKTVIFPPYLNCVATLPCEIKEIKKWWYIQYYNINLLVISSSASCLIQTQRSIWQKNGQTRERKNKKRK